MPKPIASGGNVTSAFLNDLVGVYDRSTSEKDITNSAVEDTLYSKSISAGHMSIDRLVRVTIGGDMLNNGGGTAQFELRLQLGSTDFYFSLSGVILASHANRRVFRMTFEAMNLGSASSQWAEGHVMIADPTAASTTGLGNPANNLSHNFLVGTNGNQAVDTTSAQVLAVKWRWTIAATSLSIRKKYAVLELL